MAGKTSEDEGLELWQDEARGIMEVLFRQFQSDGRSVAQHFIAKALKREYFDGFNDGRHAEIEALHGPTRRAGQEKPPSEDSA